MPVVGPEEACVCLHFSCCHTDSPASLPLWDELEPHSPDPSHLVQPGMGAGPSCALLWNPLHLDLCP